MARMKNVAAIAFALALGACGAAGPPRNDDVFARIDLGMTRDDAARIVGRPDETMRFDARGTQSWDYYYFDTWGYYCRYSITFAPDGRVASKISVRLNDGGDHGV
jgi:outer membrane protein assembly factor BamE (lipoprotein component of BamABCDE complex)